MWMKITADRDKCIASGACVLAAPEVFDQDDDGIVIVMVAEPGHALQDSAMEAVRACPAGVFSVVEQPGTDDA
jgi:ferredoxin